MSQLGALLQALRVLRAARAADAPAELCESLVELLLADLTWRLGWQEGSRWDQAYPTSPGWPSKTWSGTLSGSV